MERKDMKTSIVIYSFVIISAIIDIAGCSGVPLSFKETTLNDIYPILPNDKYEKLKSLTSDKEIEDFLDQYWQAVDSASGMKNNTCRSEYLQRLEYANAHFPDRRGWGRSDRKRIYLIYGPPSSVERDVSTNIHLGAGATIRSMELWRYSTSGKNNSLPSYGDDIYPGEKKFIFADLTGCGIYTILYSSEDAGDIDVRTYK